MMIPGESVVTRVACVAAVVCVVFPLGRMMYPAMADSIGALPFTAIEAVVTATLGFSLSDLLFS